MGKKAALGCWKTSSAKLMASGLEVVLILNELVGVVRRSGHGWLVFAAYLAPCIVFFAMRSCGAEGALTLSLVLVGVLAASTTLTDVSVGKIWNCWTIPAALLGLSLNGFASVLGLVGRQFDGVQGAWLASTLGAVGWWSSLGGFVVCFGLTLLVYLSGGCGGGDVKLAGAYGALLGLLRGFEAILWAHLVAAAFVCVLGVWWEGWGFLRRILRLMIRSLSFGYFLVDEDSFHRIQGGRIRMAACYAAGAIIAILDPLGWMSQ